MKFRDHLIRALLILIGLAVPAAISTALKLNGYLLGGIGSLILYAPFFYFIYCVYTGKIGPKLPPKSENDSVPITPEMLASTARNNDESSTGDIQTDDCEYLYCICPRCDSPVPATQARCYCGHTLSSTLPKYRLCPNCNDIVPKSTQTCECGHHFS